LKESGPRAQSGNPADRTDSKPRLYLGSPNLARKTSTDTPNNDPHGPRPHPHAPTTPAPDGQSPQPPTPDSTAQWPRPHHATTSPTPDAAPPTTDTAPRPATANDIPGTEANNTTHHVSKGWPAPGRPNVPPGQRRTGHAPLPHASAIPRTPRRLAVSRGTGARVREALVGPPPGRGRIRPHYVQWGQSPHNERLPPRLGPTQHNAALCAVRRR
jgi:hypothetical protein